MSEITAAITIIANMEKAIMKMHVARRNSGYGF
jgi:hypothetical protein